MHKKNYKESNNLLKKSAYLYISNYVFFFFKFLTGFFVASFLGPSLFGLRTLFGLVIEYAAFSHLGTVDAMCKEVPYFRGKNDEKKVNLILENVFTLNLCYAIAVWVISIVIAFYLFKMKYDAVYVDFAIFVGFYTIAEKINIYCKSKLTVDKEIHILSNTTILQGITHSVACITLTYFWGLRGLFIGLLLSIVSIDLFLFAKVKQLPKLRISSGLIWSLLRIGFPIMSIALMFILLRSVDRLIIATFLPKDQLGFFAVGTIVSGMVYFSIAHVCRTVFAPRIMEKLGETGDKENIFNYMLEPTIIIAYFVPFIVGTLFISIHIPIKYFMPAYLQAIGVIQILCLAAFFMSIVMLSMVVIIALNKQTILVLLMIATVLLNAVLSYMFIALDMGINGVAIGTCISYCGLSLISLWYAMRLFDLKASIYAKNLFIIYAPFMYLICLVIPCSLFSILNISGLRGDIVNTLINLFLFYLLFGIIFFFIWRHPAFCKLFQSISALNPKITRQTFSK